MKKVLALPLMALLLSCSSKPNYTKMVETTYNFNNMAASLIMESDTIVGSYIEADKDGATFIYENNSDFILKASTNSIEIMESKEKGNKLIEDRGFEITNKKVGDTLIIQYFPTESTPASVLKFGTEYKFFN